LSILSIALILPLAAEDGNYKQAILLQKKAIEQAENGEKGPELVNLAKLYLKDQDQERAFETYLSALKYVESKDSRQQESADYKKAMALYLDNKQSDPLTSAEKMIQQFSHVYCEHPEDHLLAYPLAISYANLNRYREFFDLFFGAYQSAPDHFLAYKTKTILHIKLMERKRTEQEREEERALALKNFQQALDREPADVTLYKLLIVFSSPKEKSERVRWSLNKITEDNIIIPRGDILFYVQSAIEANEKPLAQRFVDKAREWYPQSRMITAAQNSLYRT
jgi:hypothetical protein